MLFLPFHFLLLGQALHRKAALDNSLRFSEITIVKFAEFGFVFLLAVHMFGRLRLMAMEFLPWSLNQKTLAAAVTAVSFLIATVFLLKAI